MYVIAYVKFLRTVVIVVCVMLELSLVVNIVSVASQQQLSCCAT